MLFHFYSITLPSKLGPKRSMTKETGLTQFHSPSLDLSAPSSPVSDGELPLHLLVYQTPPQLFSSLSTHQLIKEAEGMNKQQTSNTTKSAKTIVSLANF